MQMIVDALSRLGSAFDPDALAEPALAGKIEGELCTALAARMRSVGHAPNVEIAGEWRPGNNGTRIDLAVLRDGVPDALIEAKQWRGFDIASWTSGAGHSNPLKKTREDIEKLRKLRNECKCYVLSFCVHSSPLPSRRYAGQFKYLEQTIRFGPISEDQIHAGL